MNSHIARSSKAINYLPKYELLLYFCTYSILLIYSIYHIFIIRDDIVQNSQYSAFNKGWSILNRKREDIDHEWERWKIFIFNNIKWFILHCVTSEITRKYNKSSLPIIHAIVGILFLLNSYCIPIFILICFKNITFYYLCARLNSKKLIWFIAIFWVMGINGLKIVKFKSYIHSVIKIEDDQYYEVIIILAWNVLKGMSFSLDRFTYIKNNNKIEETNENLDDIFSLKNYFGYTYYLPTIFLGPVMVYDRYKNMLLLNKICAISNRIWNLIWDVFICLFWIVVLDFSLHYIYVSNLQYTPSMVSKIHPWALYGMGYLMGQFFHMKYVVSYGVGIALSKMDGINPPHKPKCIGRIHLYSDMWKHFDQGLYEFLSNYIYKDLINSIPICKKILASFVTFLFIYFWHGFYKFILVWSMLNYLCLVIENYGKSVQSNERYKSFVNKYLSKNNEYRLIGLLGSQLFIPSAISNFYFFAGIQIGNIYVIRTYFSNGIFNYIILSILCTCIYHTSEVIKRYEHYYDRLIKNYMQNKKIH